jgi:iron complex transport system substrate-binding protein
MVRPFRQRVVALLLLWLAALPVQAADTPRRIVSINLCTDELLIALADPDQIAALSIYAADPTLSFFAEEAARFRHDAGEAETVVGLAPDLVLAGRFSKRATREMLRALGYRLVEIDPARSIEDSIKQIRQVGTLVGHPERGEALVSRIEEAEDRAGAARARFERPPTVVFYQRRGYVTGGDTLTSELLALVGLDNEGGSLAGKTGGFVSLERLIANPPDFLVASSQAPATGDQGSALLAHPALAALFPPAKRIVLAERMTVCGGPSLPAAIDWLASEAQRISLRP